MPDRRRAWARALFLAAPDRESREALAEALVGLSAAIQGDKRIREFLTDPSVKREPKASLLAAAMPERSPGAAVFRRLCDLLADKSRTLLLPEIARSYGGLCDAAAGVARLEVEAAREVPARVLERIAAAWTRYSESTETRARVKVNSALVAGYRLRAGSLRIDYSIAGRLERLRRELAQPLGKSPGGASRGEG